MNALIGAIDPLSRTVLNVDSRMSLPALLPDGLEVRLVKRSVFARLHAEFWLYRQATAGDCVVCFGNLPPLLPLKSFTSVFVQNRYVIDRVSLSGLKVWMRFRIKLERIWLRVSMAHADQFLVQTTSMQRLMCAAVKSAVPVVIAPFSEADTGLATESAPEAPEQRLPSFVYVASGEDHKNHRRLLQAWCLLSAEGIRPSLVLTVDEASFPELCVWMASKIKIHALNVTNLGSVSPDIVAKTYARSDALIYPSQLESFGLPLIEASAAGLDVVASELDYVRDVVHPVQSFDPASPLSIARAVKRYCGIHVPVLQLLSPAQFMDICLRGGVGCAR